MTTPSPDAIAKRLHGYLKYAGCDAEVLHTLGWYEFLKHGVPPTTDVRRIGADAVLWMLVSDEGLQIRHDDRVLYAVLGYVQGLCGGDNPTTVVTGLAGLLAEQPVSPEAIRDWFESTFPEPKFS